MKRFFILFSLMVTMITLLPVSVISQTAQIGFGTNVPDNTLYGPVYRYSATSTTTGSRSNILFTADELAAAGITAGATISKLAFNKTNSANFVTPASLYKMYMGNTSNTSLATSLTWASIQSTHTEVFSSTSFNIPLAAGWVEWNVTPFVYTGGSLEIAHECAMTGNGGATDAFQWEYTAGFDTKIVGVATATGATMSGTVVDYKQRPNIRITYTGGTVCTAPPPVGTATTSLASVCQLTQVDLGISGITYGTGATYKWQSASTMGGTYSDISTDNLSPTLQVTPTATTYYRAVVTCSGQSTPTIPVEVIVNSGLPAGTYTINSAVATGGTNFQTFADAITSMSCGVQGPVVFNVDAASGPYTTAILIPHIINTSSTNTVIFNGNGRTIQVAPTSTDRYAVRLDGADYVTFDNFNIVTTNATYGYGVHLTNQSNNNTISNNTINVSAVTSTTSTNSVGIALSGTNTSPVGTGNAGGGNRILDNSVTGGYYGITMSAATATPGVSNTIANNEIKDFYATGIDFSYQTNGIVSGNDIHRSGRTAVGSTFAGIELSTAVNGANVNANRIHDTHNSATTQSGAAYGIYSNLNDAAMGNENIVSNNLIYNFNSGTGTVYGIYNSGSDSVRYYHNSIVLDNTASTNGTTRGFYQTTAATGIEFRNNMVSVSRGGAGTKHAIYFGTTTSTINSNTNNLYILPAATNYTGYYSTNQATLSDWQTASGQDANSYEIEPQFVAPGSGDYTPAAPGLNNKGVNVGITTDILNAPRSASTPDIGAYEFNVAGCSAPPTAGTLSATPNGTLCANTAVEFSLSGNSEGGGQTYTLQSSLTTGTGFTDIGTPVDNPEFTYNVVESRYYRVAVTCTDNTVYSNEIFITVPLFYPAGTYTINSAVATGGTNFQTFADAISAIRCGIAGPIIFNVDVASGPYNEQVIIPDIQNTSASNTITFNGNGRTISFLSTNTNERAGIKIDGTDYVTISNFVINATGAVTGEYGFGIQVLGDADNNSILNNTVNINTSSGLANFSGIAIGGTATSAVATGSNTDNTLVSGNTVTGGNYGISLYGSSGAGNLVNNNQIINNIIRDQDEEGIYVAYSNNTLVESNDISRPTRSAPDIFTGVYFANQSLNGKVSKNKIHDPFGGNLADASSAYGIYFTSCDATAGNENIVSNNIIYNFNGGAIQYGIYNSSSDSVHFLHNTIALNDAGYAGTSSTRGFNQATTARGIVLRNNIFSIKRGGTGPKHVLYFGATTTASTIVSNNNDLHITTTAENNIGYLAVPSPATSYATIGEWRTATGQDMNSETWYPSFTDEANGNLMPRTVELDNLGVPLGITTDILNITRSATTPDIGAYEFTGSIVVPVTLLNIFASKTGNDILVNWRTTQEINTIKYEVERSVDGVHFEYAGTVTASGFTSGDAYNYRDMNGVSRTSGLYLYYRLKVIDINGRFEYSPIASVRLDKDMQVAVSAYPNPFKEKAMLKISALSNQKLQIQVFDLQGRMIFTQQNNIPEGVSVLNLERTDRLVPGSYMIRVTTGTDVFNLKLIKQ